MENLEVQMKMVELGKLLVKELQLEPGVDTLARWMAHYLSEKIVYLETAQKDDRELVQKECFDLILKLWQHRNCLPPDRKPLRNFDAILDLLTKLSPEREKPFFVTDMFETEISTFDPENIDLKSIEEWGNIVLDVDKVARIWIEYALERCTELAKDDRTISWIENAVPTTATTDDTIIKILLDRKPSFDIENYDQEEFNKEYREEVLKNRINQLQRFSKLNDILHDAYQTELQSLQSDNAN